MTTDTITTHFDYHSIDHNLLKLDILGHDDPTMIRMLQDLTGRDPLTIPLDGQDVMSLFQNTDALGITPEQIGGTKLGALGIPEFGTDFAMQMVSINVPETTSATCGSWYWIRIRMKFTLHNAILHSSATLISFHHALVKSLGEISSSARPRMIMVEA